MGNLAKSGLCCGPKICNLPVFIHGRCFMACNDSAFGAADGRTEKKETVVVGFAGNGHSVVVVLCFLLVVLRRNTPDYGLSHQVF